MGQDTPQTPLYNPADDRDERSTIDEFFFTHDDQFGEDDAPLGEGIVTESATAAAAAGAALTGSQQRQDDDTHHLLSRGSHRNSSGNGKSGSSSGGGGGHRGSPPLGGAWGRPARKWEPNLGFPAFAPDNGSYGGGGGGTGEKRVTSPIGSSSSDKYLSRPRSPLDAGVDKAWEMRSGSRSPSPRRPPAAATSSPPGSPNSSQNLTGMTTTMTSRSSPNTGISARTRGSYSSSDLNHHSKDRHYHSQNYGTRFTARRSLSSALEAKSSSRYRTSSSDTGGDYNNNSSSSRDSRLAARRRNLARRQRSKPSEQESSPRRAVALADADEPVTAEDMAVALEDYRYDGNTVLALHNNRFLAAPPYCLFILPIFGLPWHAFVYVYVQSFLRVRLLVCACVGNVCMIQGGNCCPRDRHHCRASALRVCSCVQPCRHRCTGVHGWGVGLCCDPC